MYLEVRTSEGPRTLPQLAKMMDAGKVWATSTLHPENLAQCCGPDGLVIDLRNFNERSMVLFLLGREGIGVTFADEAGPEFGGAEWSIPPPPVDNQSLGRIAWLEWFFNEGLQGSLEHAHVAPSVNTNVWMRSLPALVFPETALGCQGTPFTVEDAFSVYHIPAILHINFRSELVSSILRLDRETPLARHIPPLVYDLALLFSLSAVSDEMQLRHWQNMVNLIDEYQRLESQQNDLSPSDPDRSRLAKLVAEKGRQIENLEEAVRTLSQGHAVVKPTTRRRGSSSP